MQYGEDYIFHFTTENKLTYMCMCENKYPIETAFDFLNTIKETFEAKYTKETINSANAYTLNKEFRNTLKGKLEFFNSNIVSKNEDQINRFKKGLVDTKNTLLDCDQVLGKRGEKVQLIVKKAELLQADSIDLFEGAIRVKNRYNKRKLTRMLMVIAILLLLIYIISAIVCGPTFKRCGNK